MKIKKQIGVTACSLVVGVTVFMGGQRELFAVSPCDQLREEIRQIKETYKNDMSYLAAEGDVLQGHPVVIEIKENLVSIRNEFKVKKSQYEANRCHPPVGNIDTH